MTKHQIHIARALTASALAYAFISSGRAHEAAATETKRGGSAQARGASPASGARPMRRVGPQLETGLRAIGSSLGSPAFIRIFKQPPSV